MINKILRFGNRLSRGIPLHRFSRKDNAPNKSKKDQNKSNTLEDQLRRQSKKKGIFTLL